jgi:splicing factor U2AF subunit
VAAAETPQQTRHARRIYVGNLPAHITELQLHRAIGQAIQTALIQSPENAIYEEQDPILSVYIDHERNFGFVEFKNVAMCTACMELDGLIVAPGHPPVKVKRPNDYQPTGLETPANNILDVSRLGIISSNVQDGPNKIFIGGLHYHLQDNQVLELLTAFGKVKAFHLVKENPESDHSKGYCFVEYVDPNITNIAVAGLNGMDIGGGKSLTARLAGGRSGQNLMLATSVVTQPSPTDVSNNGTQIATAAAINVPPPNHTIVTGYDVETLVDAALGKAPMPVGPQYLDAFGQPLTRIVPVLPIPTLQQQQQQQLTSTFNNTILQMNPIYSLPITNNIPTSVINAAVPNLVDFNNLNNNNTLSTRILVLKNMVTDNDLSTEEDHQALIQEVRDECAKFGQLLNIQIPRVADGALIADSAIRKVYLEYASLSDAMQAERELQGRQFGEGIIQTEYFPENDFAAGRFY